MINLEENNNTKDLLAQYNSLTLDTINQMRVEFELSIASHIKTVQVFLGPGPKRAWPASF